MTFDFVVDVVEGSVHKLSKDVIFNGISAPHADLQLSDYSSGGTHSAVLIVPVATTRLPLFRFQNFFGLLLTRPARLAGKGFRWLTLAMPLYSRLVTHVSRWRAERRCWAMWVRTFQLSLFPRQRHVIPLFPLRPAFFGRPGREPTGRPATEEN